jgi:hypothetical protein
LSSYKTEQKWRVIFSNQINALMRALHLSRLPLAPPHDLTGPPVSPVVAERGRRHHPGAARARRHHELRVRGDWQRAERRQCGHAGLRMRLERADDRCRAVGDRVACAPGSATTLESSASWLGSRRRTSISCSPTTASRARSTLLSIDIDSYDYWILDALTVCSPRILMLEYNARFGRTGR